MVPLLVDHIISPSTTLLRASYNVASICKTPSEEITVEGVEITICAGGPAAAPGSEATIETRNRLHKKSAVRCCFMISPSPATRPNRFDRVLGSTTSHLRFAPIRFHHHRFDDRPSNWYLPFLPPLEEVDLMDQYPEQDR